MLPYIAAPWILWAKKGHFGLGFPGFPFQIPEMFQIQPAHGRHHRSLSSFREQLDAPSLHPGGTFARLRSGQEWLGWEPVVTNADVNT